MTPKKKAQELVNRFLDYYTDSDEINSTIAKSSSIICVEEIIKGRIAEQLHTEYWYRVKKEIELM